MYNHNLHGIQLMLQWQNKLKSKLFLYCMPPKIYYSANLLYDVLHNLLSILSKLWCCPLYMVWHRSFIISGLWDTILKITQWAIKQFDKLNQIYFIIVNIISYHNLLVPSLFFIFFIYIVIEMCLHYNNTMLSHYGPNILNVYVFLMVSD